MTIIRPNRRELMMGLGGLAGSAAMAACSGEDVGQTEDQAVSCLWNGRGEHAMQKRGTFGEIENVVVLMMENRSFDHMFGALAIEEGRTDVFGNDMGGEGRGDVNGLTGDEWNYDLDGNKHPVFHQKKTLLGDIAHEWDDCRAQFDYENSGSGKNDGFVRRHHWDLKKGSTSYCATSQYFKKNGGCQEVYDPMGFYTRNELPVYYALADNYTICDNWYSSVLGPTWPNRFYLHAGSSRGEKGNKPVLGMQSIWEQMREQCLSCMNYYCDIPWAHVVGEGVLLDTEIGDGVWGGILQQMFQTQPGYGSFYKDVKKGKLPAFSLIDPGFSSGYDDHPPADVGLGQAFVSYVYHLLAYNPDVWNKTLFVITYDEHGSFYDHVVPPGNVPGSSQSYDEAPDFRQLGMRVPGIVIGPHVKKRYVSHAQVDHCSVLATLQNRFDLGANDVGWLNERVRHTQDLADCIDPAVAQAAANGQKVPGPAGIPVLEFSESKMMDWVEQEFPDGQEGLAEMVRDGRIPSEHDLRPYRAQQMLDFLETGEEIGAFKITL